MRYLTALLLISIIFTLVLFALALRRVNNLFLIHIYTLIEYFMLTRIFAYWSTEVARRLILASILLVVGLYIAYNVLGYEDFQLPNKYTLTSIGILMGMISLYSLISVFNAAPSRIITGDERFWVALGSFVSVAGPTIVYSAIPVHITRPLWYLSNLLIVLGYLLYLRAFTCLRRSTT